MHIGSRPSFEESTTTPIINILNSDMAKRIVDVCAALVGLVVFSLIIIICGLAIRLGGAPSAIFKQDRMGRDGKPFRIFKLATMRAGAHLVGPLVTSAKDERLTAAGRLIRPLHLDELPQFINVLRGEMSIVGPRPTVIPFLDSWPQATKEKVLSVRPGITGVATLYFHNEGKLLAEKAEVERAYLEEILPQRLSLDLWYVDNRTLWVDLLIIFSTMVRVLGGGRLLVSNAIARKVLPSRDEA